MRNSSKATGFLAVMAGTVLLLAGCTGNGASAATSVSSPAAVAQISPGGSPIPSVSAPDPSSSGVPSPGTEVSPAAPTPPTTTPATGSPVVSSAPAPSAVTRAPGGLLDAASARWLTSYCTLMQPVASVVGVQSRISAASGDLTKIKGLFVEAFRTSGAALTATATGLQGQDAPYLSAAGNDLPVFVGRLRTLGIRLTSDSATIDAIDPVAGQKALGTALATDGPDIDKIATIRDELKIPAAALPEVSRIAACQKVIRTD